MTHFSRRSALFGVVAFGIALPTMARAMTGVALPPGPMRLTRRLERGLGGGAKIVVERGWDVSFTQQGQGCSITGHQSNVVVEAPAALAAMAQIEEERSTDAMFPILLTDDGTILAAGNEIHSDDLARAAREAERIIAARPISEDAKADQVRYLALLQQSSGKLLDRLPPDLFFPVSPPMRETQPITLADGLNGVFELSYEARPAPEAAWLGRAQRVITTRIGASERRSSEVWTMAKI